LSHSRARTINEERRCSHKGGGGFYGKQWQAFGRCAGSMERTKVPSQRPSSVTRAGSGRQTILRNRATQQAVRQQKAPVHAVGSGAYERAKKRWKGKVPRCRAVPNSSVVEPAPGTLVPQQVSCLSLRAQHEPCRSNVRRGCCQRANHNAGSTQQKCLPSITACQQNTAC